MIADRLDLQRTEHATHPSTVALADLLTLMVTGSEGVEASRERLPASLRGADGVCLLTAATRLFIMDDVV